jgi:hypothetical protein
MEPKRTIWLRDPCHFLQDATGARKIPVNVPDRCRAAWLAPACVAFILVLAEVVPAQAGAGFYKGRTVELDISTSVGGGYDAYARLLARHIGRFIPGSPIIVAKNMEGAGGLRLANFLYNAAPKDGTTFATLYRGAIFDPLLGGKGAQFDATRFTYLGSASNEVSVCVAWHTTGVTSFEQVLTKELVVGASGPSADTYQFPKIVNGVLGTKFKIIAGYAGADAAGRGRASSPRVHPGSRIKKSISCFRWGSRSIPTCLMCRLFLISPGAMKAEQSSSSSSPGR